MNLEPLHDNVLVKPLSKEEKTESGIILPDTVDKEKPEEGEVLAVGPGKLLENGQRAPMSVKPGEKVVFKGYSLEEIKIGEENFLSIPESSIIAIIK